MKYTATATTLAALVGVALSQSATPAVTTPPSLVECQPAQFTVSGGTAPYFLSVIPGGQTGSAPLETLPTVQAAGTVTWDVDIPAGTSITIQVRDSTGSLNYSQQVTIQPGSDTCIGANSSLGGSSATQSSTNASGARSTAATTTSGPASSAASSRASVVSSASSAASSAGSVSASSVSRASSSSASAASSASSVASSTSASSAPSSSASNSGAAGVFAQSGFLGAVAAVVMAVVA